MNQKKAKAIRKFLGKIVPKTHGVIEGTRDVVLGGKSVTIENCVPSVFSEDENQTRSEYRRLKKMFKQGELPL